MKTSARNIFEGTVSALALGPVSAEAEITTAGGSRLVATITQASATSLGLAVGKPVVALIKASSVMIMTEGSSAKLSARNCLVGTVTKLTLGPVSAEVGVKLADGNIVSASITREAANELGLAVGAPATAVIKASSVIIGVPV